MASNFHSSEGEGQSRAASNAKCQLIRDQVLAALGRPKELLTVQVRELWAGRFRVNVVTGSSYQSARIDNSYFVCADEESTVLSTVPVIRRRYGSSESTS